jgi:DNA-binding MarR family transcriptional regulator
MSRPTSSRNRKARARAAGVIPVADRLHSAAIHLLRRIRAADAETGLTAPRLSALSVVVFAGPQTLSALAAAEQVRLPTMTRLVQGLERDGLVARAFDPDDRRRVVIRPTARGAAILRAGRARRVARLAESLEHLPSKDLACLCRAAEVLEALNDKRP